MRNRERQASRSRAGLQALPKVMGVVVALLLTAFTPSRAHAYTWMIKHGYGGCPVCHADPSGGELLTAYGRVQSDLLLRMRYTKDNVSGQSSKSHGGSFDSFESFDSSESEKPSKPAGKTHDEGGADKEKADKPDTSGSAEPNEGTSEPASDSDAASPPKGKEAGVTAKKKKKAKPKEPAEPSGTDQNPLDIDAEANKGAKKTKAKTAKGKHKGAKPKPAEGDEDVPQKASGDETTPEEDAEKKKEEEAAKEKAAAAEAAAAHPAEPPPSTETKSDEELAKEADAASEEKHAIAEESAPAGSGFLWGLFKTPDWLLLGGSYRHMTLDRPALAGSFRTFPMMLDMYGQVQIGAFRMGGSIGGARVAAGSPYARSAQITHNQGKEWNLLSRTHWVGLDFDRGRYTVRAGRLNLPFGIRIPEHTMWVRQITFTDRESSQEHGVALAFNGESWRGEVMAIAGNYQINPDEFRNRGYSLYLEYLASINTAIGVSSLITHAKTDRSTLKPDITRMAHGVFMRAALTEQLVLLAEADALKRTGVELGYVGFAQFDYELVQGLHAMLTGETLDAGFDNSIAGTARAPGAGKPLLGGWASLDWFFLPHCEFRADVMKRQQDSLWIMGQLHVFL